MEGDFPYFELKPKIRKILGAELIVEKKRSHPVASSELLMETTASNNEVNFLHWKIFSSFVLFGQEPREAS